jgi:hypothetical protein
LIGPKDSDQLLDVMAATSEMLSVQPTGSKLPTAPNAPPSASSDLVAGTVEGGIEMPTTHSADAPAGLVQPGPSKLEVTPVVAEPL